MERLETEDSVWCTLIGSIRPARVSLGGKKDTTRYQMQDTQAAMQYRLKGVRACATWTVPAQRLQTASSSAASASRTVTMKRWMGSV